MKSLIIFLSLLLFISCQNTNQRGLKTINDSSQLIRKDSLLTDTSTNQVSALKNNTDEEKISCDSLLNLFGRSSSYDRSMQLDYVESEFDSGILYIQVFDPGGQSLFGNLDLDIKKGILTIDKPGTTVVLQYDTSVFNRLIKHCKFYQTDGEGTYYPNDSVSKMN